MKIVRSKILNLHQILKNLVINPYIFRIIDNCGITQSKVWLIGRRHYEIDSIFINDRSISEVVIDSHYENKHTDYVDDNLILILVSHLDGGYELPVDVKDNYSYFVKVIELNKKYYRLIWLLENKYNYIGIINAFRVKKGS